MGYEANDDRGDRVDVVILVLEMLDGVTVGALCCVYNRARSELTTRVATDLRHALSIMENWLGEVPL